MTRRATYAVAGMTCQGCVRALRNAISLVDGVTDVDVQLEGGIVTVTSNTDIDEGWLKDAVADAGYEVTA